MRSYAIRTRRRSPNTLFRFRTVSENSLPKDLILTPFWKQCSSKIEILSETRAQKNVSEKGYPPGRKQDPTSDYPQARRLPDSPPRVRGFLNRNNNLSKKQQQLLLSQSISESFSWNRSFLSPFLDFFHFVMKPETKK